VARERERERERVERELERDRGERENQIQQPGKKALRHAIPGGRGPFFFFFLFCPHLPHVFFFHFFLSFFFLFQHREEIKDQHHIKFSLGLLIRRRNAEKI